MKSVIKSTLILGASFLFVTGCGSDSKSNATEGVSGIDSQTALSIVYDSTELVNGKMVGYYHIHAVDDNGKPLAHLPFKISLINGVKEIYGAKVQSGTGIIAPTKPITFGDSRFDFSTTNVTPGDTLIVLPTSGRTDSSYLGDWTVIGKSDVLSLRESSYNLQTTDGLSYILGREERLLGGDIGRGTLAVAHVEALDSNGSSTTDKNGFTNFKVVFDPVLLGHTITIGAHTNGNRLGVSKVIGLRGGKFSASSVKVPNTGESELAVMYLAIDPGNGAMEYLMDVDIVPSSFEVTPEEACRLNMQKSDFHTDGAGRVHLVIDTNGSIDDTGTTSCEVKWNGGITSIYLEY